ncbi:MAG TPA: maltose alpha-D-glucosyltransferase [Candidatus Paceibacterota bacterium]|nr:maltose alpha-D-glucosyltransferase [Candidatus Paceibacterota bacterium]
MVTPSTLYPNFNPLWYKSAIIYEVPVRAFFDSNADGIGDFRGLTQKLDYIQDLGVTAVWLLPFYPSPLKDDGYDIADYYSINPIYGTLEDFKEFLAEAHSRGLRVITELVLNHTSDQHHWFQKSRRAKPGSREREFYVWSDTPEKYKEARIIFKDFEPSNWTWDPVARSYYWHRFYSHQPDLNYDNPEVHAEIRKIFEFWLDLGVDGFRLDAIPYLYEREGTSCESLRETHDYLKDLRKHLDEKYGDRMLLAEANQWPEEAVTYFGAGRGDECHMAFHFPLMPRLFMAIRMEDRVPVTDILDQTPTIPETSQWALFLRNHDELTLEMVTDEERDYMYRVYASNSKARLNLGIRRRLAPLLNNDRKRIELLNLLLLSLPGTPVIYYGDELGMGDNIFLGDRNGVRTPMQWSADKNAGFSRVSPQALFLPIILDPEYHYEAVNVDIEQQNLHSLLWWTKRVLALRKRWKVFGTGTMEFLQPENRKVLVFLRQCDGETVLVVANLSRYPQPVSLDLSRFQNYRPVELFGRTEFPPITANPYPLTLSPHSAFWFSLEPVSTGRSRETAPHLCKVLVAGERWQELLTGRERSDFELCLPGYLQRRRWFSGRGDIKSVRIRELLPLPLSSEQSFLAVLLVEFAQFDPEEYLLPVAFATGDAAGHIERENPHFLLARVQVEDSGKEGILYDAAADTQFSHFLFEMLARQRTFKAEQGQINAISTPELRASPEIPAPEQTAIKTEQRNTAILYADRYFLKLFRRLETGINPGLESAQFLAERNFPSVPAFAGALELQRPNGDHALFGIMTRYVPNAQDGWHFTLDALRRYFDRVQTMPASAIEDASGDSSLVDLAERDLSKTSVQVLGTFFETARLLGQRTGELHLALASDPDNRDFAPEPFTPFYQRSLYQSFRNHLTYHFQALQRELPNIPQSAQPLAKRVLAMRDTMLARFRTVHQSALDTVRIRCHGNFHLGHVLHTGKDFVVIDFEGEPARSLSERRIKRPALRDVAAMIRSLDCAAHAALFNQGDAGNLHEEQLRALMPWTQFWSRWMSASFLGSYLKTVRDSNLVPKPLAGISVLLDAFVLDRALTEMGNDLTTRPHWLHVSLQSILQLMERSKAQ